MCDAKYQEYCGADTMTKAILKLKFHGKIIDQLGSQTYQSLTGSIAELIANAWDADSTYVKIDLPKSIQNDSIITIADNGIGLTFSECNDKYLNIGWCTRGTDPCAHTLGKNRPILGRKGIGKFAGFGIAKIIQVETISKETGEKTTFEMDLENLTDDNYMVKGGQLIAEHEAPDESRKINHGTKITLKNITLKKIQRNVFPKKIARKFLLHQTTSDFKIYVDEKPIPESVDQSKIEYSFPKDYDDKLPVGLRIEEGFGIETLSGREIRWKIYFFKAPIHEEGLQGITVFANGKLAQQPFFFKDSSTSAQAGQAYMSGLVKADYIDELEEDLMSAERLRINWEHAETAPLLEWGQRKVNELRKLWAYKRGEQKRKILENKVDGFADQLNELGAHESKTVRKVLTKIGGILELSDEQFTNMAKAILDAWNRGRLRDLADRILNTQDFTPDEFLNILIEAEVMTALNIAESISTKIIAIKKLQEMIMKHKLENSVRDHIAKNPWLISPKFETFRAERVPHNIVKESAEESKLTDNKYKGRIDLVLKSNKELLVLEFMRPGLTLDWDHMQRFERYVVSIRTRVKNNTALEFDKITGYLVADNLSNDGTLRTNIQEYKNKDMIVSDWKTLLQRAENEHEEYLEILKERGRGNHRLNSLHTTELRL